MNPSHLDDLGTGDCGRTHPILEEYEALSALYAKETAPESWADMQLTFGDEGREGQQKAVEAVSRTNGMDTERMVHICNKFDPWQVYDPNSRLNFVVERIKGYPAVFAQESCTPWMHKELYREEMEPSIQSCFTISALYSTVSDSNRSSVYKVLKQGPAALKQAPDTHIPGSG
ncbi:unnamed protein product [Parascedosporium putredinis]|uniref:Uncharacterized protein n=1 Tax=Parascedosporium putredinis TaxID=1442378 RepID=A0A9P1HBP3_9PEZI|nr:unnamed protein product [Parascedosporium putredinis]CAI8004087.1 unnamed protein product [Parascedosporium putredinis]